MTLNDKFLHGALIFGAQGDNTFGATVERRVVDGEDVRLILALQSPYATSLLESMKSDFLSADRIDDDTARRLVSFAAAPFAAGGAVLITMGDTGHIAVTGNGLCGCERASVFEQATTGTVSLAAGDRWVVSTGLDVDAKKPFFSLDEVAAPDGFANDTLDDALAFALRAYAGPAATATTWVAEG